jgi:hypothetical protein
MHQGGKNKRVWQHLSSVSSFPQQHACSTTP